MMKKRILNCLLALGVLVLWGAVVGLLLPTVEMASVAKTVSVSALLFLPMFLIQLFGTRHGLRRRPRCLSHRERRAAQKT